MLAAGLTVATLLLLPALLTTPTPAGACYLVCPSGAQELSNVRVTLISGDAEAATPEWSETGRMNVTLDGTPDSLSLNDHIVLIHADEEE